MLNDTLLNRTYPDAYIEHYGRIYLANPIIRKRGVLFDTFLLAPQEILRLISPPVADVDDYRPLLLKQRQVRAEQDWIGRLERARFGLSKAMHG